MQPNEWGKVLALCWDEIPIHFPNVELDAFVIMPNHVHGVIIIPDSVGGEAWFDLAHEQDLNQIREYITGNPGK